VGVQSVLALYGADRTNGLVVDCGHGSTHIVPISAGFPIAHAIVRLEVGGRDVAEHMGALLAQAGHNLTAGSKIKLVRDAMEQHAYVALHPATEQERAPRGGPAAAGARFELSDGTAVALGPERFLCAELLFGAVRKGTRSMPVQDAVIDAIGRCDAKLRAQLLANVVLAGGMTCVPGFGARLRLELSRLRPKATVAVIELDGRQHLAWTGAATLSALDSFQALWATRADFMDGAGAAAEAVHDHAFV
jgi:actin-related protein